MSNSIGRLLRLDEKDDRIITMCGMAAGFSALFGTPLAAAILAMADMGLFELALDASPVALRRTGVAKARPEDSPAWRWMDRWRQGNWNP